MKDNIDQEPKLTSEQENKITRKIYEKELREVIRLVCEGRISIPPEQREYVWEIKEKSKFVGNFLLNFNSIKITDINRILVTTTPDKKQWDIYEGQQRITSLIDYLYTSKVEIDELHKDTVYDLLELRKKNTKNNKVLNANIDELGFKLDARYMDITENDIKKKFNRKKASDLNDELIKKALNQTIQVHMMIGEKDEIDKLLKKLFSDVNSGKPVTEAEKTKSMYCRTTYYMQKKALADKLKRYIKIKDKNNTKVLTLLIDIDRARNGQYSASHNLRNKFLEEKKEDLQYINKNNELTIKITNILLDIFGEDNILVEFNNKKNFWNSSTNSTIALPWYLAIEQLLNEGFNENVFEQKRISILEKWKEIKFVTGRKSDDELKNKWTESKTDHSANKSKVIDRINMIKNLLKDSIK